MSDSDLYFLLGVEAQSVVSLSAEVTLSGKRQVLASPLQLLVSRKKGCQMPHSWI